MERGVGLVDQNEHERVGPLVQNEVIILLYLKPVLSFFGFGLERTCTCNYCANNSNLLLGYQVDEYAALLNNPTQASIAGKIRREHVINVI